MGEPSWIAEYPEPDPDHVTWMLDLDERRRPWRAHRIVEDYGEARITACGQRVTRWSHYAGWWVFPPGQLPLSGPGDIHCGGET